MYKELILNFNTKCQIKKCIYTLHVLFVFFSGLEIKWKNRIIKLIPDKKVKETTFLLCLQNLFIFFYIKYYTFLYLHNTKGKFHLYSYEI